MEQILEIRDGCTTPAQLLKSKAFTQYLDIYKKQFIYYNITAQCVLYLVTNKCLVDILKAHNCKQKSHQHRTCDCTWLFLRDEPFHP